MKLIPWIAASACLACGRDPQVTSSFELRRVSAIEIARLASALPASPVSADSAALRERVQGLMLDRAHSAGKMRALELDELVGIGVPAVGIVDALIEEREQSVELVLSALEVLGAIDVPASADALVKRLDGERVRDPVIRRQAAFQLAKQSSDHVLLRLLAQLKYETDGETVIWMAAVLARHKNYAGLDGLRVLAATGSTVDVRAKAAALLATTARDAGFADADALYAAWCGSDAAHRLPEKTPSPRLLLETWRRIASLSEFDLRIVDDVRFSLSRSPAWVVGLLVAALHEDNAYVRLHVAQCLERMGPRASGACGELVRALDEHGVSAAAATALGAIHCSDARHALVERLRPQYDPELRNAAAAALGKFDAHGAPDLLPALRAVLAPLEPLDLRQAAAQSLLALGDTRPALPLLVDCLTHPGADAAAAETAIEDWLTRSAQSGDGTKSKWLAAWKAALGPEHGTPTAQQATARRSRRASIPELVVPAGDGRQ